MMTKLVPNIMGYPDGQKQSKQFEIVTILLLYYHMYDCAELCFYWYYVAKYIPGKDFPESQLQEVTVRF